MSRRKQNTTMGFFTAFFTTLLIMALVLCVVYLVYENRDSATGPGVQLADPNTYLPQADERLNILVVGREDDTLPPDFFLLVGFLPDTGKISVCFLPPGTALLENGSETTLATVWDKGGARYAQRILAEDLSIPIDRYMNASLETLDRVLSSLGLMDYYLPVDLHFALRDREVNMPKGDYQLDGRKAADILCCNNYSGGEIERSDRGGMLFSQVFAKLLPLALTDQGDQMATNLLNWTETDISFADYEQRRKALEFLAALELPATTTVFLDGTEADGTLRLSLACRQRITAIYSPPHSSQEETPEESSQDENYTGSFSKGFY